MALIKCPECNKEVSDTAETCPHCGYRFKKPTPIPTTTYYSNIVESDHKMEQIGGIIGGIIGIIGGIVFLGLGVAPEAKAYPELGAVYVISGIILIVVGIIAIAYSAYRLIKNH